MDIRSYDDKGLSCLRNEKFGFVYQFASLIPTLTVAEIVLLPIVFGRRKVVRDAESLRGLVELGERRMAEPGKHRSEIRRRKEAHPLTIYKFLPRTNCKACGQPTCLAFSALAATGAKGAADCVPLQEEARNKLHVYLSAFRFD